MTRLQEVLDANVKLTPMMEQYVAIRQQHPDALVLFRMGDFYEVFFEDAINASKVLNITLTHRGKLGDFPIPMAGIPHHAAPTYIDRLTGAGLRCAICEQVQNPKDAKGIVKRAVTQTVSPGMPFDFEKVDTLERRYIACISHSDHSSSSKNKKGQIQNSTATLRPKAHHEEKSLHLILLDFVTGDFRGMELKDEAAVIEKLKIFEIKEVISYFDQWENHRQIQDFLDSSQILVTNLSEEYFKEKETKSFIKKLVPNYRRDKVIVANPNLLPAMGALSYYVCSTQSLEELYHIRPFHFENSVEKMRISYSTLVGLEILPGVNGQKNDTLWGYLNRCQTPMGSRELKAQISAPLLEWDDIDQRHQLIGKLKSSTEILNETRNSLGEIRDIDRILAKISMGKSTPSDLINLYRSIAAFGKIPPILFEHPNLYAKIDQSQMAQLNELLNEIETSISVEVGAHYEKGNLINPGANKKRDKLARMSSNANDELKKLEQRYRAEIEIPNLKIKFNNVAGYFIEVSKGHISKVPEYFNRRQTLVNSERYTTPELDEFEKEVLSARDKLERLERKIFEDFNQRILYYHQLIQEIASNIALADFYQSLAWVAVQEKLEKPVIAKDEKHRIFKAQGLWHPLIKKVLKENFVGHNIELNHHKYFALITGPNMAGKTTVMREVAIAQLLAQMGSFVPANFLELSLCDQIFSRLGASDDIVSGQSTFMVEMSETAEILRHSTEKSLILLDEIGRGTSTFDGLSIAWALVEHLVRSKKSFTLFSTHYHELIELVDSLEGAKNLTVETINRNGNVRFLYNLIEAGATQSFGIHVAKLAGLPKEILVRSRQKLKDLEGQNLNSNQLSFFGAGQAQADPQEEASLDRNDTEIDPQWEEAKNSLIDEIKELDLNQTTPIQAINHLYRFHEKLN
jgi:DNA mismatch repair protein MutS